MITLIARLAFPVFAVACASCDRPTTQNAQPPTTNHVDVFQDSQALRAALTRSAFRIRDHNPVVAEGLQLIESRVQTEGLSTAAKEPHLLDATISDDRFVAEGDLIRIFVLDYDAKIRSIEIEDASGRRLASFDRSTMKAGKTRVIGDLSLDTLSIYVTPGALDKGDNDPKATRLPRDSTTIDSYPVLQLALPDPSEFIVRIQPQGTVRRLRVAPF